jgi:hypothetical protein
MVENPDSRDKALEALDFIFNVLKDHEQVLDKSIHDLAIVTEQISETDVLDDKVAKVEEKITQMQKQVTNLIGYFSNAKGDPSSPKNEQVPRTHTLYPESSVIHSGSSVVFHCKQWGDFQALAMHAQTFSFNFKEDEKVFQAGAIKGNQIITYVGALPEYSIIFKAWLSRQLETTENNILEGSLEKPK